mmetsp:Transcript_16555/g.32096  ORF Transcript_16555/g.32096 Transcript_16555/m.32096 type:complete len:81 (-) Transcript_16555:105-347(-)
MGRQSTKPSQAKSSQGSTGERAHWVDQRASSSACLRGAVNILAAGNDTLHCIALHCRPSSRECMPMGCTDMPILSLCSFD